MVRRRDRILFSCRSSWARAKLSSLTKACTDARHPSAARALVAGGGTGRNHTAPTQRMGDARPCRGAGLSETGNPAIRRVAQHGPDRRAFPAGTCLASGDALGVDPPSDLANAESFHRVHLIDALDHPRLGLQRAVRGGGLVGLADITVPIRSPAHYAYLACLGPMSLTAARSLQNLSSFVLRYHSLELHQQLIFRAGSLRRFDKQRFHPMAGQFLDQQNLVRVLAAQ